MIKRTLSALLLTIWIVIPSYAQNSKSVIASVKYKTVYKKNDKILIDDICTLEITKSKSHFYSDGVIENIKRINDKYEKAKASGETMRLNRNELVANVCKFEIIKDYEHKKAIYIQNIANQEIGFVEDSLSIKRWHLLKETININGLKCYKATMKKDTVDIVAWFCPDIPFQEGPVFFYGLPGLILKASTNTGFDINLISVAFNKDMSKEISIKPYALVSELQMKKAIENQNATYKKGVLPNGDEMKQRQ